MTYRCSRLGRAKRRDRTVRGRGRWRRSVAIVLFWPRVGGSLVRDGGPPKSGRGRRREWHSAGGAGGRPRCSGSRWRGGRGCGGTFAKRAHVNLSDGGIASPNGRDGLEFARSLFLERVVDSRCGFNAGHNQVWANIGLDAWLAGECRGRRERETYLVPGVDYDMRTAEEVGDGAGVGVEETFAGDGDTIAAPVDLHELGQSALQIRYVSEHTQRHLENNHVRWGP